MTQLPQTATVPRAAPLDSSPRPSTDVPLKEVLVELWQNVERLMRQELALASAEIDVKTRRLKEELTASAIGAALAFAGVLAFVAAVILLLALAMPAWLAALVTSAAAMIGGVVLLKSKQPSVSALVPERTIQNVKQDLQSFREAGK